MPAPASTSNTAGGDLAGRGGHAGPGGRHLRLLTGWRRSHDLLRLTGHNQVPHRGVAGEPEPPVEQAGRLLPGPLWADLSAEHGDDQPASVALGRADEGVPGDVGEACLAAERTRVLKKEPVVVLDREPVRVLWRLRRHPGILGLDVPTEVLISEAGPEDQGQVIRARHLTGSVQSGRCLGVRVPGPEPASLGVHVGEPARNATGAAGEPSERVGRIVTRVEHQA